MIDHISQQLPELGIDNNLMKGGTYGTRYRGP